MRPRLIALGTTRWIPTLVLGAIGFLAVFYRLPEWSRYRMWKEDHAIYLDAAAAHGAGSWFDAYAGYLHLLPRITATVITWAIPIEGWAVAVAVAMALLTSLLGLAVLYATGGFMTNAVARLLVWALFVIAPSARMEVLLSLANLQWYLLTAAFVLLVGRRPGRVGAAITGVVLFFALTTCPFALGLVPLAAWRVWKRRDWTVGAAALAGTVLQAVVMLGTTRTEDAEHSYAGIPSLGLLLRHVLVKTVDVAWIGPERVAAHLGGHEGLFVALAAALLAFMVVVAWLIRRGHPVALVSLVVAVVYFAGVLTLSGTWQEGVGTAFAIGLLSRYWFFAAFLVGMALAVFIDAAWTARRWRWWPRIAAGVLLLAQVAVIWSDWDFFDIRAFWLRDTPDYAANVEGPVYVPDWPVALEDARAECRETGEETVYLYGHADSQVWDRFTIACDRLD